MHGFFCVCSFILVYFLYPETKGVPLEEMDRVFGEDEREEALENESEVTSLIPDTPRRGRQSFSPSRNDPATRSRGWINRVLGGANTRALYEPIASSEE